jgi:hypothetical protein
MIQDNTEEETGDTPDSGSDTDEKRVTH